MTALRKNLAGKIRDSLEAALEIDPGHAMMHLMLGIWHADVAIPLAGEPTEPH